MGWLFLPGRHTSWDFSQGTSSLFWKYKWIWCSSIISIITTSFQSSAKGSSLSGQLPYSHLVLQFLSRCQISAMIDILYIGGWFVVMLFDNGEEFYLSFFRNVRLYSFPVWDLLPEQRKERILHLAMIHECQDLSVLRALWERKRRWKQEARLP